MCFFLNVQFIQMRCGRVSCLLRILYPCKVGRKVAGIRVSPWMRGWAESDHLAWLLKQTHKKETVKPNYARHQPLKTKKHHPQMDTNLPPPPIRKKKKLSARVILSSSRLMSKRLTFSYCNCWVLLYTFSNPSNNLSDELESVKMSFSRWAHLMCRCHL